MAGLVYDWQYRVSVRQSFERPEGVELLVRRYSESAKRSQRLSEDKGWEDFKPAQTMRYCDSIPIGNDEAQGLLGDLWRVGARPAGYGGTGEVEGLKGHLADMQRLVFDPPEHMKGMYSRPDGPLLVDIADISPGTPKM